jgi:hypothetical protein
MKQIIKYLVILPIVLLAFYSCDDAFKNDYVATVNISFPNTTDNIATVDKGVFAYTASISVTSSNEGISSFELWTADAKSGDKIALISEMSKHFDPAEANYSVNYDVTNLTENKCIKVIVTDMLGNTFQKNLLVKVTPSVLFSYPNPQIMETADCYYGSYYATWLEGRVYLRSNGSAYANQVDFSMGHIEIGGNKVPALVSPAKRADYGLPTMSGLQSATFELTTLTLAQFDAIPATDASVITALADPAQDAVQLTNGKIYVFKTANGKKGLIHVAALTNATGTIEDASGNWIEKTTYSKVSIRTKTVLP